jgi:protein O-mannosyl-transferase
VPVLVAIAAHARSLSHEFMSDDGSVILGSPQVTEPGHLRELLTTDWFDWGSGGIGYYRPVAKVFLRVNWVLGGGRAWAFHLANVLLHAAATLALAALLSRLAGPGPALVGASLFAVHPSLVQAIDLSARTDLLAAVFTLTACLAFVAWAESGRITSLVGVVLASLFAFGSKEATLLLPLFLVPLGLRYRLSARRFAMAFAPILAAETFFVVLRQFFVRVTPIPNALAGLSWGHRLLCVPAAVGAYVGHILTATPIARLPRVPESLFDARVLVGLAALAGSAALVLRSRGRSLGAFGVTLFFGSLAPALVVWMIHIPRWKDELPIAERWLYLPLAGLAAAVAALAVVVGPRKGPAIAFAALVVFLGAVTWERAAMYRSQEAMAEYVESDYMNADPATLNPRERYFAAKMRTRWHLLKGEIAQGLDRLLEADRIAPALPDHLPIIAQAELDLGQPARAVDALERLLSPAFAADPAAQRQRRDFGNDFMGRIDWAPIRNLLGRAYGDAGRPADADRA